MHEGWLPQALFHSGSASDSMFGSETNLVRAMHVMTQGWTKGGGPASLRLKHGRLDNSKSQFYSFMYPDTCPDTRHSYQQVQSV